MRRVSVLIIEDEAQKREQICAEVERFFGEDVTFEHSETFGEATQKIYGNKYDLIVIDLLLPRRDGDDPVDVSDEMIDHLVNSEANRLTTVVAISQFEQVVDQRRGEFAKAGIFLIDYTKADEWRSCLRVCMQKVTFKTVYDFVIICALEIERSAFAAVSAEGFSYGALETAQGLDIRELKIGSLRGVCVLQPRMGLVDASIVTARALEAFNPKLVCMAGICGGFSSEVNLGALLVSDTCWEHQAGKWEGPDFEIRSWQEPIDNTHRTILSQMIENDQKLTALVSKQHEIQMPTEGAYIRPTVSGSAVIASTKYAEMIAKQHGKVSGVDMEVYGVYRAAALHKEPVICFAAKTVVDHADERKDAKLQQAGAILSARFVVKAIEQLVPGH
jgi:adenosylhomocysteine nucleosidase